MVKAPYWGQGWSWNYNGDCDRECFYGYVLESKFFHYPPRVQGFTLKYIYDFYPRLLKKWSIRGVILIPNHLLDTLRNSKLTRLIRLNQEKHLSYSEIHFASDCLTSTEHKGIVSSYQGKTISQIIRTKGGTAYLRTLLELGKLKIDRDVLEDLAKKSCGNIEEKGYDILISVIKDIEDEMRQEDDWAYGQMEEDNIRYANEGFDDMMDDFDAWGNID